MKYALLFLYICSFSFNLKPEVTIKAENLEKKDLGCITLLKLASEKSKNDGEMEKYDKLKKLKKSFQKKYEKNYFSKKNIQSQLDKHNFNIKQKGKRYLNKGLQKCGLK
tara:strand:- start:689 stop:1015 length:327 start_codon:yes stop_codon:yes gene_type:complete